ncbi:MAG TPA: VanW family protein [Gaiellaceae bacterium]|nr:VanW family protein [Gaiellaceae bacterium]
MRAEAGVGPVRQGRKSRVRRGPLALVQRRWKAIVSALALLVLAIFALDLAYAGSPDRVAGGVTVSGLAVGGLDPQEAERKLAARAEALASRPVVFTGAGRRWSIAPAQLAVRADWKAAVAAALERGDGARPVRGLRRLRLRLFGADVEPSARADEEALRRQLRVIERQVAVEGREAAVVLRDGEPVVIPGEASRSLRAEAAASAMVSALAALDRGEPVPLPMQMTPPEVGTAELAAVARQVRTVLSAPVTIAYKHVRLSVSPEQMASFLELPHDGQSRLSIGGPAAEKYFADLGRAVWREPREVDFSVDESGESHLIRSRDGRKLDVAASERALLTAASKPVGREAGLVVVRAKPKLSTERAKALGITGLVGRYTTFYGGDANRIHNVQLVARLIDRHLIAPHSTFSFNKTTGERNAAQGFLEAPVIINGELETGLGGGVCQVSTTVFNAAFEAGLPITSRTNHALYIDHYPLGRDATVNYPDTDLTFQNDSDHWLLLRTIVGSSSLSVRLFGTPLHRRVETQTSPLRKTGRPPVEHVSDPHLYVGQKVVEEAGQPSRSVSVRRLVYDAKGKLLFDTTWYSNYVAEAKVVRVGTKAQPVESTTTKAGHTGTTTGTTTGSGTTTGKDH